MVGSGYMGRTHAEAIKCLDAAAALAAVCGGARAPDLAKRYGVDCEPTVEGLVRRSDIDAVVITSPHHWHAGQAMLALDAGKHVMVETPMATRVADCDRMIEAAARRHLVIGVGYITRFREAPRRARELVANHAIGHLRTMMISILVYSATLGRDRVAWRFHPANVGNLIDCLPHALDWIRWTTGAEAAVVAGLSRTLLTDRPGVEDTTVGLMELNDGCLCSVNISAALPMPYPGEFTRMRMIGSTGILDFDHFGELRVSDEKGWRLVCTQPTIHYAHPEEAFRGARMTSFIEQMQSFIDGIHGKPMETGSGIDGRAGIAASLAMIEASQQRRVIDLA